MSVPRETSAPEKTSLLQTIFRVMLGLVMLFAGTAHLTWARDEFAALVPRWVPLSADPVVVLSGIAELLLGVVLFIPGRFRVAVGWLTTAFLVAVFPGNLAQYLNQTDAFGLKTDQARFTRLFFQPVLIGWALWSTGAWQARYRRRQRAKTRTV